MPLAISCTITVFTCVVLYIWTGRPSYKKLNKYVRQTIIGVLFGLCAIYATEFGAVEVNGAALNCRDTAPIIAGLMFGPWSGILAGFIGGTERFFASFHGIGVYTQIACSLGCYVAGLSSALVKQIFFRRRRATVLHAFVLTLFVEAMHMAFVPLTHLNDFLQAAMVMYKCFMPLLCSNAIGVIVAFMITSVIYQRRIGYDFKEIFLRRKFYFKHDLFYSFQFWLLLVVVVCFGASIIITTVSIDQLNYKGVEEDCQNQMNTVSLIIDDDSKENNSNEVQSAIEITNIWVEENFLDGGDLDSKTWLMITDNDFKPLAGYDVYFSLADKLKDLPEDKLCYVDCKNSSTGKSVPLTVLYQRQGSYIAVIYLLEKFSMYLPHVSAATTMTLEILVFGFLMIVIFILLRRLVGDNINKVNSSLVRITEGNLDEKVRVYSHSEFAQLSDSINSTVDELKNYIDAEANRFKKDFEMANLIQSSALPKVFPEDEAFDLYANNNSAKEVGGDFYDFCEIDNNHFGFLIADVSGKGIAAAMVMMKAKSVLQESMKVTIDPSEIMQRANKFLCQDNDAGMFVTCWLGILNIHTGEIKYASAGHNPPIIKRSGKPAEYLEDKPGLVLGAMDIAKYKTHSVNIGFGDFVFIYTDGITEANNMDMELFAEERLLEAMNKTEGLSAKRACELVIKDVDDFVDGTEQADDQTVLGLRYLHHPKRKV